jgi:hypothetical protein
MKLTLNKNLALGMILLILVLLGFGLRNFPFTQGNFDDYRMPIFTSTDVSFFTFHSKASFDSGMPIFDPAFSVGGVQNVISPYPPLMYTFTASMMHITGLLAKVSPYQMVFILICLLAVLAPLYGFILIRRYFNTETAIIVLVLSLIPPTLFLFPVYIGFWGDIFSFAPAIAALFFIKDIWHGKSYAPLFIFAILSAAAAIGHAFEFMYALFFLCLTILFLVIRKIEKRAAINTLITFLIIAVLLYPYIFRYNVTSYGSNTFQLGVVRLGPPDYFPPVTLEPWLIAGTVIGIIVIFLLALQKKLTKYQAAVLLFPLFIVGIVLGRYIGIENMQTYRQLYHGLFFLLLPAAFGLSVLLSILREKFQPRQLSSLALIVILAIIAIPTFSRTYSDMSQIKQSLLPKNAEWDSLMWIRDNTTQDSKIMSLFGLYGQSFELFSERQSTWYPPDDQFLLDKICNGTLPDKYGVTFRVYFVTPDNPYFKILNKDLSISRYHYNTTDLYAPKPLEAFDYILLRYRGTQVDPCMQFYATEMIKRGNTLSWNNDQVLILKVNKNATRTT